MDEIKDIQRKDKISQFIRDKFIRTDPFDKNVLGAKAYRRAEKITGAIHLVTGHMKEHEPARLRIRRASLGLLSSILSLKDEMRASGPQISQTLVAIRELISLTRVLSLGGFVSAANAEILEQALDELGELLSTAHRAPHAEAVALSKEIFLEQDVPAGSGRKSDKGQFIVKDKVSRKRNVSNRAVSKSDRSQRVLSMLSSKEALGIKDVVARLPDYSEKMVQRELKHLVAIGKARKSGSKRWSTYSLV